MEGQAVKNRTRCPVCGLTQPLSFEDIPVGDMEWQCFRCGAVSHVNVALEPIVEGPTEEPWKSQWEREQGHGPIQAE